IPHCLCKGRIRWSCRGGCLRAAFPAIVEPARPSSATPERRPRGGILREVKEIRPRDWSGQLDWFCPYQKPSKINKQLNHKGLLATDSPINCYDSVLRGADGTGFKHPTAGRLRGLLRSARSPQKASVHRRQERDLEEHRGSGTEGRTH